jgi:RNA polymerase sigma factor (sigma-70 family)
MTSHSLLSAEREVTLAKRYEKGDLAAKDEMITKNIKLVYSIARKYITENMDVEEHRQNGMLGLIRAVEKFDYHRGYKFSTYATWWIKQAITRAIADYGRTIRVPVHTHEYHNKILQIEKAYEQQFGMQPTVDEISAGTDFSAERIETVKRAFQPLASLDATVGESEDTTLGDFVASQETSVEDQIMQMDSASNVELLLSYLGDRQADALRLRFGLEGGEGDTLEDVGKSLGVTRERARQIIDKALEELNDVIAAKGLDNLKQDSLVESTNSDNPTLEIGTMFIETPLTKLLSERELEILAMLDGLTYKQIARHLGVSANTVRTHIYNMVAKSGLPSIEQLAVLAAEEGIIDLSNIQPGQTKTLTFQEATILQSCYDTTYKDTAEKMGIASTTVRTHWHNIYAKINASSRTQAALVGYKDGLINTPPYTY